MAAQVILGELDEFLWRGLASSGEQLLVDVLAQLLNTQRIFTSCGWYWKSR